MASREAISPNTPPCFVSTAHAAGRKHLAAVHRFDISTRLSSFLGTQTRSTSLVAACSLVKVVTM